MHCGPRRSVGEPLATQPIHYWLSRLVQARWSGESGWVPLGDYDLGVDDENATSRPGPGQILWHPPGASEAELLVPYGRTVFSSVVGPLAGNHFLTMHATPEEFAELGRKLLWEGAQMIRFEQAAP